MTNLKKKTIPPNPGRAYVVKKGQRIRVIGRTIVDFVAFNFEDLRERFDQGVESWMGQFFNKP